MCHNCWTVGFVIILLLFSPLVPGKLEGSTSESGSDMILIVTLQDGMPAADQFYWVLSGGVTVIPAGNASDDGKYIASQKIVSHVI